MDFLTNCLLLFSPHQRVILKADCNNLIPPESHLPSLLLLTLRFSCEWARFLQLGCYGKSWVSVRKEGFHLQCLQRVRFDHRLTLKYSLSWQDGRTDPHGKKGSMWSDELRPDLESNCSGLRLPGKIPRFILYLV